MKNVKNFLRTIDIYGTTFYFKYRNRERYQTATGGIIVVLFIILVLIFEIYYFIPFVNRKNYNILYYTMNLAQTEEVNIFQSESNFAIGLFCSENDKEKLDIHDLLEMKPRYTSYVKDKNGKNKFYMELTTHKCTYKDFYNKYNDQVDILGLSDFECLDDRNQIIQGIYTDQLFSYYDFTVKAKNDSVLKEIDRFLFENECKLEFYYIDIIIDLDNYKQPIKQYLNQAFIQLNPTLNIKRNIFYMNQYFSNDNYLLFIFGDEEKAEIKPLYSRYEEYILYKGLDRVNHKTSDYSLYSKLYLRADLKKMCIKRKYQKFIEFYADSSSLLIVLYEILFFIFSYFDYFYAYHSLGKYLFFFKELEDENNFNIFQKRKELMNFISSIRNNDLSNSLEEGFNAPKNIVFKNSKFFQVSDMDEIKNDIQISKNSERLNFSKSKRNEEESAKIIHLEKSRSFKPKKLFKTQNLNFNKENKKSYNNFSDIKGKSTRKILKKNKTLNRKNSSLDLSKPIYPVDEDINIPKIKNSFNIFEIIITQIFKSCMSRNIKIKDIVYENENKIINKKLDIITYVRNMILFDIINNIIINDNNKYIINFLCRPIISINSSKINECDDFYKHYKKINYDKFSKDIQTLLNKPDKDDIEKRLIYLLKEHLNEFS